MGVKTWSTTKLIDSSFDWVKIKDKVINFVGQGFYFHEDMVLRLQKAHQKVRDYKVHSCILVEDKVVLWLVVLPLFLYALFTLNE